MEFHDVLHGCIVIDQPEISKLVGDLLDCTELQRLRSMRQMNFDVSLIQELGRSRRLPHSIGVTHISLQLAQKANLPLKETKELVVAALLHDAAIPPYGHLVETEFKRSEQTMFDHAKVLESLIFGKFADDNSFQEILPGRQIELHDLLVKHNVDHKKVLALVAPLNKNKSAISADIDLDNIDNVHRMAILLGWEGVKENISNLLAATKLNGLKQITFSKDALEPLKKWLEYREKIYTLIIAHPECIPQNALQSDLVECAVDNEIISNENWFITEPEFEEKLRSNRATKALAGQLLSGCNYSLIDYVWFKDIGKTPKLRNSIIKKRMEDNIEFDLNDVGYFIWYEKGLISRKVSWKDDMGKNQNLGENSHSCMIALLKKTKGGISRVTKTQRKQWRENVTAEFELLAKCTQFETAFPLDYSGNYFIKGARELELEPQQ